MWLRDGEAFFDVAHDARRPFNVLVGDRRVTVVGTKFSLRRDGERLLVDVVEGRVQVQQVQGAAPVLLTRGESAVGEGDSLLVTERTERQSVAATSWLEGRLVFDQMTIADAAAQFDRYNRKKLVVADAAAATSGSAARSTRSMPRASPGWCSRASAWRSIPGGTAS